ncbi:MAG: CapA family protein [Thomasclavelia sp.]|nr:CapA family protein [Thomasclavelia sp.]
MKKIILFFSIISLCLVGCSNNSSTKEKKDTKSSTKKEETVQKINDSITISFAGDCTLGNYAGQAYSQSFNEMYQNQNGDSSYFFRNVAETFKNDDYTVVNLEGPLTTATSHVIKTFPFSGKLDYAKILTAGNIECVSYANNHSEDYYDQGLSDTKKTLDDNGVSYFGYETTHVQEIKGIKCGFLGYRSIDTMNTDSGKATIKAAIDKMKNESKTDLIFIYFHWGIEREYSANNDQRELAHFCIDNGVDAVIGSHPHVVQGTETYNGKEIVYSLGNFCFGGNRNPSDQDSMIYQLTYNFKNSKEDSHSVNIIPCKISSTTSTNNYQPTIQTGTQGDRILQKIKQYSF